MPANLMMEGDVAAMAYIGATPWHGSGQELTDDAAYDIDAFAKSALMDWEAEKVQLCTQDTHTLVDQYAVRRKTDGLILGVVGARYTILQNKEAFKWFSPWLDAKEAALNTAGLLFGGSRVWVLAKLNRDPMEIAPGDMVEKYVLLSHSHDGSLAVRVGFTPIRVVCSNTMAMAHGDKNSKLIRVKHSKNVLTNIENIRDTMNLVNQEFEATAEQYRKLASKSINQADLRKYVKAVFEVEEEDKDISTRQENILKEVMSLMDAGKGNDLPGVKGTYWAAYNSVTEYLSWQAGRNVDNRLNSLWFGQNKDMNIRALELAVAMAA